MEENKGCAVGVSFFFGILCFVLAFFAKQTSDSSKGASIKSYIGGKQVSSGIIGGNSEAVELFQILCYAFILAGIILTILGIILACIPSSKSSSTIYSKGNSSLFIKCPNCGEENGYNNDYCYKCRTYLNQKPLSPDNVNSWKCSKCGKINQNYVGTCGCGEVKPK